MRWLAWIVTAVLSFVSGGFGIPVGFALGLAAWEVLVAACTGAIGGLVIFLYVGDAVRARVSTTAGPPERDSAARRVADRFGARGLGLVGPLFPGTTLSVVLGLAMGFSRRSLAVWMSIGILALYSAYTVGLWALIGLIGIG